MQNVTDRLLEIACEFESKRAADSKHMTAQNRYIIGLLDENAALHSALQAANNELREAAERVSRYRKEIDGLRKELIATCDALNKQQEEQPSGWNPWDALPPATNGKPDWQQWYGGGCPVAGDQPVEIMFRDGHTNGKYWANFWNWQHRGIHSDIVAYRPLPDE
jgi:DNA repair exonuclease SbcCD ATPase subunit